jgi:RNA-directed DNA polymerase
VKKFTFLGFDFKPRRKWNTREYVSFTGFDLGISQKAQERIRNRIVRTLSELGPQARLEEIADCLNARLRGWTNYFAKMDRFSIRGLWAWFNFRLIKWLMRNRKRFKNRINATVQWLKRRSKLNPKLFAHWQFGCTP